MVNDPRKVYRSRIVYIYVFGKQIDASFRKDDPFLKKSRCCGRVMLCYVRDKYEESDYWLERRSLELAEAAYKEGRKTVAVKHPGE